jgi:hypothetical protein
VLSVKESPVSSTEEPKESDSMLIAPLLLSPIFNVPPTLSLFISSSLRFKLPLAPPSPIVLEFVTCLIVKSPVVDMELEISKSSLIKVILVPVTSQLVLMFLSASSVMVVSAEKLEVSSVRLLSYTLIVV